MLVIIPRICKKRYRPQDLICKELLRFLALFFTSIALLPNKDRFSRKMSGDIFCCKSPKKY